MDGLINWVWQGTVVTLAMAVVLGSIRSLGAPQRYVVWWATLAIVLCLPLIPRLSALATWGPPEALAVAQPSWGPLVSVPRDGWAAGAWLSGLWALWVGASLIRIGLAFASLRRASRACRPVGDAFEARLRNWSHLKRLGRRTTIVLCDRVSAAAVIGLRAPRIALAPELVAHLRDDEIDRVVVHEWAHVQRRDQLANLAQLAVRTVAGWHPAVWWVDRQLHLERETACDETVVAVSGSPRLYAADLVRLASLRVATAPWLPAPGAVSRSAFEQRIRRILTPSRTHSARRAIGAWSAAAVVLGTVSLSASQVDLVRPDAIDVSFEPSPPGASVDGPPEVSGQTPLREGVEVERTRRTTSTAAPVRRSAAPVPVANGEPVQGPSFASHGRPSDVGREPMAAMPGVPAAVMSAVPLLERDTIAAADLTVETRAVPTHDDSAPADPPSPWEKTAAAGVAIGRGSQKAAVAAAGFFSSFGKKLAGSF